MLSLHPTQLENPTQHILNHKRPEISDMGGAVNRGPAAVKPERFPINRFQRNNLMSQCVKQPHARSITSLTAAGKRISQDCVNGLFWHNTPMSKRTRMILTGFIPILGVSAALVGVGLGGKLPGFTGEFFRKLTGFMFTPVFLELTFAFLGLLAVFWINSIRLQREGDEYVSLEIENDQDEPQP